MRRGSHKELLMERSIAPAVPQFVPSPSGIGTDLPFGATRRGRLVRVLVLLAAFAALQVTAAGSASATRPEAITLATSRFQGSPGVFTASGAISDTGSFTTRSVVFSAIGAPTFLIVHAVYEFTGTAGTFVVRTEIIETLTADPYVLIGHGTWVVEDGTGAYANLHARGEVTSLVDDHFDPGLFLRTYTGSAQLD
jgi:hypothetical protein